MNHLANVCRCILENNQITQRELAQQIQVSLGKANSLVKECIEKQYVQSIKGKYDLTESGKNFLYSFQVDNAIILAAGFGKRFVPFTFHTPKGLLEIHGERMIEREIEQLLEKGITDITIVVGYLKEQFDYLIDKYGVKLLYNPEYAEKNNLTSLYYARHLLKNTYILTSDHWMSQNLFHQYESNSWYTSIYQKGKTSEWCLTLDGKKRINKISIGGFDSYIMYGPVYMTKESSEYLADYLEQYYRKPGTEDYYWERILMDHLEELPIYANIQPQDQIFEIENLEQLRQFDHSYQTFSNNESLAYAAKILDISEGEIHNISCLKSGMTNRSFLFTAKEQKYIFRVPGEGTDQLINRYQEYEVYQAIRDLGVSETILSFDPRTGYKLAHYYEGSRNADAQSWKDTAKCMAIMKKVHEAHLTVKHCFDLSERIDFYENLCRGKNCIRFYDYREVKQKMNELLSGLQLMDCPQTLCHVDCNPDNFILLPDGRIKLLDWEYAGMCDPLIDVAMYAIYSYYDEEQSDRLLEIYLGRKPTQQEQLRTYSYMALGGFLWAIWTEYKQSLGNEFGEYGMKMYRYAKDYYRKIKQLF